MMCKPQSGKNLELFLYPNPSNYSGGFGEALSIQDAPISRRNSIGVLNTEGQQPIYRWVGFSTGFYTDVYQRQSKEHLMIRHSLFEIGYSKSVKERRSPYNYWNNETNHNTVKTPGTVFQE